MNSYENSSSTPSTATTSVTMSSEIGSPVTILENALFSVNYSTSTDESLPISEMTTVNPMDLKLPPERTLSVAYTVSEAIVSLLAIFGNALVVYIFCKNRSLRRYRNYYIVALAIADFLVGLLGIPFAILASIGYPRNLYGCLFTVSILMVLCTVSILCLVAVSIDRYWATTNPFAYYRNMTTTTAVSIILFCWVAGAIIGFLPLFGWYNKEGWERDPSEYCFFTDVMDYSYLVFLYFATIVFPALLMIAFYGYIYHVVLIKIRQKGTMAPQTLRRFSEQSRTGSLNCENRSATQVLRIMVSEKRREAKAAKKLGIIVLFFMLCWMPLYTINCIQAFYPDFSVPIQFLNFTIILSHANSALNPFLYAYHLKEFRLAMKHALMSLCGKLLCGLVNVHVEKENPLGPMSRSLTMPSLGHVTTVPNPSGKVSIKFRKISRPDEPRSVQISPTNINSMIPTAVTTASRDNLLRTAGGTDKSLTSLSLASDTSNQLLEIPLQVTTSASPISPKNVHSNGASGSRERKSKSNSPTLHIHLTSLTTGAAHKKSNMKSKVSQNNSHSSSSETVETCYITTTPAGTTTTVNNCQEVGEDREKITNTNDLHKYNACVNMVSEKENEKHSYIAEDEIQDEYRDDDDAQEEEREHHKLSHIAETETQCEFHQQNVFTNSNEETSSESSHDDGTKLVRNEKASDVKAISFSSKTKQQQLNGFDSNSGSNCISLEG
ncbi:unnamed protein product [Orchesella dallaii]|uniref:G-protein coupled receptors family 1 profile domain-containing protein n=1 Tax=Orchesella dallaii TaxID=48710 RepID=A0ABP1QYN6_9HEXA